MIETPRLLLRTWHEEDAKPFAGINQDPKVIEFLRDDPMSLEEAQEFIRFTNEQINTRGFGWLAATLKDTHELIGFIGLHIPGFEAEITPCIEIGWRLAQKHWGKGYASEGANALLELGFNKFSLDEIVSFTAKDNIRSAQVMERIGMTRDFNGDFDHPKLPPGHRIRRHIVYRISKEAFLHRKIDQKRIRE
jgi:ribosomal-protein-alanine N-acetyltransferase